VIETVRGVIDGVGLTSVHAASAAAALERIPDVSPRTIVVDDRVDDMPLRALIRQVQAVHEGVGTVVLTDASQPRAAALPGCELMERSSARERVDAYLRRLVETGQPVARPSRPLSPERRRFFRTYGSLFRRGPRMREVERAVFTSATDDTPVLITGESGVGKKSIARAVHYLSPRTLGPLVQVSCAALPPGGLEQELFGGKDRQSADVRTGKIEAAHGGTLVLDEVGDLPLGVQQRLVGLLEAVRSTRNGDAATTGPALRIVATTSKDLDMLVRAGAVREDLYERLRINAIAVPALRERRDEIAGLAEFFRINFMEQYRRETPPLSDALQERLSDYAWPGNVLELENLAKRYVVLGDEAQLLAELGARSRLSPGGRRRRLAGAADSGLRDIGRRAAQEAEMIAILAALEQASWNRAEAARLLKVSYKTLLNKLNRAGISRRSRMLGNL